MSHNPRGSWHSCELHRTVVHASNTWQQSRFPKTWSENMVVSLWNRTLYPLVNVYITMERSTMLCSWVNPLCLWPCSSSLFVCLPEGISNNSHYTIAVLQLHPVTLLYSTIACWKTCLRRMQAMLTSKHVWLQEPTWQTFDTASSFGPWAPCQKNAWKILGKTII